MFRRLRFEHYFFSSSFEGDEFEQHNYWKAAAATLSTIKLPDPELVISELGAMAVQMESGSPLIVPYLVGAIASIGSRHTSMAASRSFLTLRSGLVSRANGGIPLN